MKRRTLRVESFGSLDEVLSTLLPVPLAEARALVAAGAVYLTGRRCRDATQRVPSGSVLTVVLEEGGLGALEARPRAPAFSILHEDDALLAVNKPAGVTAQPTPSRMGDSLLDAVSAHLGRPAGLIHRLDRETSGVTVFAKTSAATGALAAQFREGAARKRYLAAAGPRLTGDGTIALPLSRDPSRPGRWRASDKANGLSAHTDFRTLYTGDDFSLVLLLPRTGRTHQLRAHLTALGAPILGDVRYGGAREARGVPAPRCLLHAHVLELAHPSTRRPLALMAPVPEDLLAFFTAAGREPPPL